MVDYWLLRTTDNCRVSGSDVPPLATYRISFTCFTCISNTYSTGSSWWNSLTKKKYLDKEYIRDSKRFILQEDKVNELIIPYVLFLLHAEVTELFRNLCAADRHYCVNSRIPSQFFLSHLSQSPIPFWSNIFTHCLHPHLASHLLSYVCLDRPTSGKGSLLQSLPWFRNSLISRWHTML